MSTTLSVSAIKEGTVIDHITAGHALTIVGLLDLSVHNKRVTIGLNLPSKRSRYKDIIKVEGRELDPQEVSSIALLCPNATVNIIKQYNVAKKFRVELPNELKHVVVCPNPTCITNHESMVTSFGLNTTGKDIYLSCHYCEKIFHRDDIKKYNHG